MSVPPIEPVVDPDYDVCLWPVDPACMTEEWEALEPAAQHRALALASATLRRLTGYRVSACPITVRPCSRSCAEQYGYFWMGGIGWTPHINVEGQWVNGCGCLSACGCTTTCEVSLPAPVVELVEVNVAGTVITDVKVMGNRLVYTGAGECPFPATQDLAAPPGAPNTFTVTYMNTHPPDGMAAYAAGVLAMEFAKACSGKKCSLPSGTTNVIRAGVTIEIAAGTFPNGVTGIKEVDAFIGLWRPEGSPSRPPKIWSPRSMPPRIER